jgi:beta-lactam-binding protein with PASTA domain
VPNLSDDTRTQAVQALQAVGLVLGTVSTAVDKYCNHDRTVMHQDPLAGTAVISGSAVSITIGVLPSHPCS